MREAVQVTGARLRAMVTMIGVVLVMLTGAAVAAKPAAAAPAQVSVQDATAVAPDTGRRCYRQTYWHHHHRYTYYKCRWYNDHHDNHGNNHHRNNHWNDHHGNDNHHGGNRW
ncbi:hypothetical protein QEZ54_26710 [Catellatospora sp. KI3]|uniref:hypothetical protein n=1 Tax=Catellatospora sp. KI3 TaxID=3041620 RepID=UPI00248251AA|nr:hypothetical protein [Catellatospora sp. KI3]MDI1464566.1 hypothetical protein [Catellatospora sp. KI3]